MSEKLRECPFCGGEALEPVNMEWSDNEYKDWVIDCKDCCARVFDVTKDKVIKLWNTRAINIPKHEKVEQWESRTGESYPDDAPVYTWINGKEWILSEWENSWAYIDYPTKKYNPKVIVANHHGKPDIEDFE